MTVQTNQRVQVAITVITIGLAVLSASCATQVIEPLPALPETPTYTQVAHPAGFDIGDVRAIFHSPLAPKEADREALKACDSKFNKVAAATQSRDEVNGAVRELLLQDPVFYHWCFYSKILEVHDYVASSSSWTERQKNVLDTYLFLVPLARNFKVEFNDSRYLRWVTRQYKDLSEWVFFRRVELSKEATLELLDGVNNPFALWRKPDSGEKSVLEKYGIPVERAPASDMDRAIQAPLVAPVVVPVAPSAAAGAAVPTP